MYIPKRRGRHVLKKMFNTPLEQTDKYGVEQTSHGGYGA